MPRSRWCLPLAVHTGTSNGGLTAHPGGDRWLWEQRIFGHAYDDAPLSERPKYGALNHRRRRIGAAPRFGSAHLRLTEAVLDRTTFCFPDSTFELTAMGTVERFDLLPLAENFDARLRPGLEPADGGVLDDYVEAHVHGTVELFTDAEAVVLDPPFGTRSSRSTHGHWASRSSGTKDVGCCWRTSANAPISGGPASSRLAAASQSPVSWTRPSSGGRHSRETRTLRT